MKVSVGAFLSAVYVNSSSTFSAPEKMDKEQSRARSSFWVSVGDQIDDLQLTDSVVDTRQFYGTVLGKWGEVLFDKYFEIFSRTTVFNDVNLMGVGNVSQTLGVIDSEFVSFGNLGTGHTFPLPIGKITYRSPDINGLN
ncbi:MAG: hypothetical protein V5789_13660 [Colwellia sp.]